MDVIELLIGDDVKAMLGIVVVITPLILLISISYFLSKWLNRTTYKDEKKKLETCASSWQHFVGIVKRIDKNESMLFHGHALSETFVYTIEIEGREIKYYSTIARSVTVIVDGNNLPAKAFASRKNTRKLAQMDGAIEHTRYKSVRNVEKTVECPYGKVGTNVNVYFDGHKYETDIQLKILEFFNQYGVYLYID